MLRSSRRHPEKIRSRMKIVSLVTSSFRNGKLRPRFRKSNDKRSELVGSVAPPIPNRTRDLGSSVNPAELRTLIRFESDARFLVIRIHPGPTHPRQLQGLQDERVPGKYSMVSEERMSRISCKVLLAGGKVRRDIDFGP